MAGKFEVYEDKGGQFRWRLKAGNGHVIAAGEATYATRAAAVRGAEAVVRAISTASAPTADRAEGLKVLNESQAMWRVGFPPDPWAWPPHEYVFYDNRWDDPAREFRAVYSGASLLACLLEVLAYLRADPMVKAGLEDIDEDPADAAEHPTVEPGTVADSWRAERRASRAWVRGQFCAVTHAESIAELRPHFLALTRGKALKDFDASVLKSGDHRDITQAVRGHLQRSTSLDGLQFNSRHGDELELYVLFERAGHPEVSPCVTASTCHELDPVDPELLEAFRIHRLRWAD